MDPRIALISGLLEERAAWVQEVDAAVNACAITIEGPGESTTEIWCPDIEDVARQAGLEVSEYHQLPERTDTLRKSLQSLASKIALLRIEVIVHTLQALGMHVGSPFGNR